MMVRTVMGKRIRQDKSLKMMCVSVSGGVCVCVCVSKTERERERETHSFPSLIWPLPPLFQLRKLLFSSINNNSRLTE